MKKIIILTAVSLAALSLTANAITPVIDGGMPDRAFSEDRTLYYVKPAGDVLPKITAPDAQIIKEASDFFDNNVTVLKDNASGKEYRFVIENKKVAEITKKEISAAGILTIEGGFSQNIGLIILKPKSAYSQESYKLSEVDFSDKDDVSRKVFDMRTLKNENGITYTFPKDTDSGMYSFALGDKEQGYTQLQLYYTSSEDITRLIEKLNNEVKNQAELDSVITEYGGVLGVDSAEYAKFTDKSLFYDMLVNKGFSDISDISAASKTALVLCRINHSSGDIRVKNFTDNADILSLDLNGIYNKLLDKAKLKSYLTFKSVKTAAEAKAEFNTAVSLLYVNESDNSNIKTRFESVKDDLQLPEETLRKYDRLSPNEKTKALSKIPKSDIFSAAELSKALLGAISSLYQNIPKPSGGGSGGGGGSITATVISGTSEPEKDKPKEEIKTGFTDIDGVPWAKEAILLLKERNAISGRDEKTFAPNDYITREEFIKILITAIDYDEDGGEISFSDVNENDWYFKAVSKGVSAGIIKGISENEFGTGMNITRQDMAVMIYRAALAAKIDISGYEIVSFSDNSDIADYAKDAVKALTKSRIISGMGDGTFMPSSFATRAQAAKMIYSLISND